jgi:hypothetical protein
MALREITTGITDCPKCGAGGPMNFRIEERASVRRLDKNSPTRITVVERRRMLVCIKCGQTIPLDG